MLSTLVVVSAALVGLTQIGGTPITPGHKTGFSYRVTPSGLTSSTDVGDMDALVVLTIAGVRPNTKWHATVGGRPLALGTRVLRNGLTELRIAENDSFTYSTKFKWRSGTSVVLTPSPRHDVQLRNWRVYSAGASYDSRGRALWRRIWFWLWLGAFTVSTMRTAYTMARVEKPASIRQQIDELFRTAIHDISGKHRRETRQIRSFLTTYFIDQKPLEEALTATLPKGKYTDRRGLLRKSMKAFHPRLEMMLEAFRKIESRAAQISGS